MLAICSACNARTTRPFDAYPGRCQRCGTDTMEKQVFPWQVQCLDCGHIQTAETTPDNFRSCRCLCHQGDAKATNGGGSAGRRINQSSSGPQARSDRPEDRKNKRA